MKLLQCLLQKNDCYVSGKKIKPTHIVVHSTAANNKTIKRYVQPHNSQTTGMLVDGKAVSKDEMIKVLGTNGNANHWNRGGIEKCVNAFIGELADGSIATIQTLPWNTRPWGCGRGKNGTYNDCAIQFEICEDDRKDKAYLAKVYKEAVELCAYLCKNYDIKPENIVSHYEAYKLGYGSNHGDVNHWFNPNGYTMAQFRKDVAAAIAPPVITPVGEKKTLYRVQVGAYSKRENAEAMLEKLKKAGFEGFIKVV